MDFEQALIEELKGIPELGGRVYPLDSPKATKHNGVPYLIVVSNEGMRDKSLDGYLKSKAVLCEINIVTQKYKGLKAITKQVVALLIDMEGRRIGTNGPFISELKYERPRELYEEKPDLYRCLIEFTAYFDEEG